MDCNSVVIAAPSMENSPSTSLPEIDADAPHMFTAVPDVGTALNRTVVAAA